MLFLFVLFCLFFSTINLSVSFLLHALYLLETCIFSKKIRKKNCTKDQWRPKQLGLYKLVLIFLRWSLLRFSTLSVSRWKVKFTLYFPLGSVYVTTIVFNQSLYFSPSMTLHRNVLEILNAVMNFSVIKHKQLSNRKVISHQNVIPSVVPQEDTCL